MTTELMTDAAATAASTTTAVSAESRTVDIRALDLDRDAKNIHVWLTHPRAHYWQMTGLDESGVCDYLGGVQNSGIFQVKRYQGE